MPFSLSSLLNPEPANAQALADQTAAPVQPRKHSVPPIQYSQSPEQRHAPASSPHPEAPSQPQQRRDDHRPATAQEAAHVLASLSSKHDFSPRQAPWYGQTALEDAPGQRPRSFEHRPSASGHGASIELPPPPSSNTRKMSSPTLEQYHVASRSPEQRRRSIVSPTQPGFTLPPMQGFGSEQQRRPSLAQAHALGRQPTSSMVENSILSRDVEMDDGVKKSEIDPNSEVKPPSPRSSSVANTSNPAAPLAREPSPPAAIKQEPVSTSQTSSPIHARRSSMQQADPEASTLKAVAALKNEHSLRVQSPLRESSVPMPSTEAPAPEQTATTSKKRSAPSKKKGTATTTKKPPPSKKRKLDKQRSATPSSLASKPPFKTGSSKGTPANSSPAPSNRSYSAEANDEPYDDDEDPDEDVEGSGDVYCLCRKPDNGTFMIGCDGTCDDWFHGKCVGIEERDKNLIDKYMCPGCTKAGIGRTTWKRMCRRSGCRQPARVGKSKGGKDGSKYCSEECGVLYFREMVARTRGREDTMKNRSSRRKTSIANAERPAVDDDLGARGGVLAAGEVKGLLDSSKTAEDFKKLGEGVLSPPATPDGKEKKGHEYTEDETQALAHILRQKDDARRRHQLLKDRMKFITLIKQAASRTATEKELKPKEYCGYDSRLEWTEAQFKTWRESSVGQQAFELDTLAVEKSTHHPNGSTDADMMMVEDENRLDAETELCDRKKCARHLEWGKLAVDDIRFEMGDNSDRMRALDREERGIKERAALRSKAANVHGEGSVEVHHGLGITEGGEKMEVDGPMPSSALPPVGTEKIVVEAVELETAEAPAVTEMAMDVNAAA